MKTALFIEDGVAQIVLTPQSEAEKHLLSLLHEGERTFDLKRGNFYHCRGGWVRQSEPAAMDFAKDDDSTIVVLRRSEA